MILLHGMTTREAFLLFSIIFVAPCLGAIALFGGLAWYFREKKVLHNIFLALTGVSVLTLVGGLIYMIWLIF